MLNLFRRMKNGLHYKQMIKKTFNNSIPNDSKLFVDAKIKYCAQSTFHTVDR